MERVWVVIGPGGERFVLYTEPSEGIDEWAKGLNVTLMEYHLACVKKKKVVKKAKEKAKT